MNEDRCLRGVIRLKDKSDFMIRTCKVRRIRIFAVKRKKGGAFSLQSVVESVDIPAPKLRLFRRQPSVQVQPV